MKFMGGNNEGEKKNFQNVVTSTTSNTGITVVGAGVTLVGKIVASGAVEIQGQIKGDIETTSQVLVGETGVVEGVVKAAVVVVKGTLSGEIHAKEIVRLAKSAKLRCNVIAAQLEMESGAELVGSCTVSGSAASNVDQVKPVLQKLG